MSNNRSLKFTSYFEDIQDINDSFATANLRVAFHGMNRNSSNIYKSAFEKAVPSMYNIPIVVNYLEDVDDKDGNQGDFGGHDVELKKVDGQYKIINNTSPIGVVPESALWNWEEFETLEEGIREYFTTQVILWKRQEAYNKIKELKKVDQSMEIQVKEAKFNEETGYYDITDFIFEAFCLLGTNVEPCFSGSQLELNFSKDNFKKEYQEMIKEFKEFRLSFNDINNQDKGGMTVNEKLELLKQFGLTQEQIDFNIDELTVEELENKLKEFKQEPTEEIPVVEETPKEEFQVTEDIPVVESVKEVEQPTEVQFDFNTISEKFKKFFELSHDEVRSKIYSKLYDLEEQDEEWYWISNVYDTYFTYENDSWGSEEKKVYKQNYIKTDNDIAFDGERIRLHRMELTDAEKQAIDMMRMNYSTLETEVNTLKEDNKNLSEQLSTYQINELNEKRSEVYSLFSEAFSEDELNAIKEKTKEINLENLENEMYKYVGKKKYKFSKTTEKKDKSVVKFTAHEDGESNPYPGLTQLYNKIK